MGRSSAFAGRCLPPAMLALLLLAPAADGPAADTLAADAVVAEMPVTDASAADTLAAVAAPPPADAPGVDTLAAAAPAAGRLATEVPPVVPKRLPIRPFGVGERFKFSLQYGPIKAGTATLSVEAIEELDGLPCYRLASEARSNAIFNRFYKVRDRVESYPDLVDLLTRRSAKELKEGKHERRSMLEWDQESGKVTAGDGQSMPIDPGTRDVLSAFYYVRTLDLQVGDRIPIRAHDDGKTYDLWIVVQAEERIDTPLGRFDCLVVEPELETDGLFKRSGSLRVWVTRDAARMPVMMQSKIKVGAVSAILVDMQRGRPSPTTLPVSVAN